MNNQINKKDLIEEIKTAFKDAEFPSHLGLHAALAMDSWINDREKLKTITKEYDYQGDWWDVPATHLEKCGALAFNYLDPKGVFFYFPAFMLNAINDGGRKAFNPLLTFANPSPFIENGVLEPSYCDRYELFAMPQKQACKHFFYYVKDLHSELHINVEVINDILDCPCWAS